MPCCRGGDYVYGSSGDFGPAPLTAINAKTGEIKWQERAFPKASFVYADGKFIVQFFFVDPIYSAAGRCCRHSADWLVRRSGPGA